MLDEKAQLHTLEGVAAATIMLLVIGYVIDATSLTPLTSSTANVHIETELQMLGQDILSALDYSEPGYNSKLKNDVLGWTGNEYIWSGSNYVDRLNAANSLNNSLTDVARIILVKQGIAHNVELTFLANNGTSFSSQRMIYNGEPSNNAVIISRKLTVHDGEINKTKYPDNPVEDVDLFLTNFSNIIDVKLILWRT